MKSISTLPVFLLFLFSSIYLNAQITTASQWTWIKGDNTTNAPGVYGTQGVAAAANKPGARGGGCASWRDASGNLWLFGGTTNSGWLADLWKYNATTNQWAWMKGTQTLYQLGVYGTQGVPAAGNMPGARYSGATWTDTAGNFWLFGGQGLPATSGSGGFSILNDLWKYNPTTNEWTWMNGTNTANQSGIYGTQGVPAAANRPGARHSGCSWRDAAGKFWLFGGQIDITGGSNFFNDLWQYDPVTNQWTWMNGPNTVNQSGVYGTTGLPAAANTPGARSGSFAWTDASGNLWLFGGGPTNGNFYNDLWKYDAATNQWACISGTNTLDQLGVYGTQGVTAAANKPGARGGGTSWTDATGNFYLFGGYGSASNLTGYLNDLWSYNPATGRWTWIKGASSPNEQGVYGTQGTADPGNRPGARAPGASWVDSTGNLWLFGGAGSGFRNDLWKINNLNVDNPGSASKWAWLKGDNIVNQVSVHGTKGVADAANKPGARGAAFSWKDNEGSLWLFGGNFFNGNGNVLFNDLWKYNAGTNQWVWMHGSNTGNQPGIYGTKGVADPANTPGARNSGVTWTDTTGNLWLFGGQGNEDNAGQHFYNDLWKYNTTTNQWSWVSGDSSRFAFYGVYGTKGVPDAANKPGVRYGSSGLQDGAGNFWLFGGQGAAAPGGTGFGGSLNDLWKYNPATNQWAWMNGTNLVEQPGIYGSQGMATSSNTPGSRYGGVAWNDANGVLWLFGGSYFYNNGTGGTFNDLWRYNTTTNEWAWISGANITNQPGVYGTVGTAAPANMPGARDYSVTWKDAAGDLWLFGGYGYAANIKGYLNDLWKYNTTTGQWTWADGAATINQPGVYGTMGVSASGNVPGSRVNSVSWTDTSGNFWLFGGYGYANNVNAAGFLSDLWKRNSATVSAVSVNNGLWSAPSTWAGGVVPSANSIVVVRNAVTVQANASCYTLRIEGSNGNVIVATGVQFVVLH